MGDRAARGGALGVSAAALLAMLAGSGLAGSAAAETVRFGGSASLREQFTSNAFSTTTNSESDLVTTATGSVQAVADGARLDGVLRYSLSYDHYFQEDGLNGLRQTLAGSGTGEVLEDHFFIDADASLNMITVSQSGATTASERTAASNRSQALTTGISPYWVQRFGEVAEGVARYSYERVTFMEADVGNTAAGIPDSQRHRVQLGLNSGDMFQRVLWGLQANDERAFDAGNTQVHSQSVQASGEYRIRRAIGLVGSVGYDRFDGNSIDEEQVSGVSWTIGVDTQPTPRSALNVEYGRRYEDMFWTGDARHRFSPAVQLFASLNYAVQTQQSQVYDQLSGGDLTGGGLDSLVRQATSYAQDNDRQLQFDFSDDGDLTIVDCALDDPTDCEARRPAFFLGDRDLSVSLIDTTFRSQTFQMGLNGVRGRTSYSATAAYVRREFLGQQPGTGGGGDRSYRLQASASRDQSSRLSAGAAVGVTRTTGDLAASTTTWRAAVDGVYDLSEDASASLAVSQLMQESAGRGGGTLTETAITATLSIGF